MNTRIRNGMSGFDFRVVCSYFDAELPQVWCTRNIRRLYRYGICVRFNSGISGILSFEHISKYLGEAK